MLPYKVESCKKNSKNVQTKRQKKFEIQKNTCKIGKKILFQKNVQKGRNAKTKDEKE